MCSDLSSPPSAPEDSYSSSRVSPPSISFLVALFLVFPPRTPTSSLFPARPRASHGQNTSISVLPLVASMSYLLSSVLSLPVYAHLFSSQSRRPSAFSSRSTFHMPRFSSPVLWSLSMLRTRTATLVGLLSLLLQFLFSSPNSPIYPSRFFPIPALLL